MIDARNLSRTTGRSPVVGNRQKLARVVAAVAAAVAVPAAVAAATVAVPASRATWLLGSRVSQQSAAPAGGLPASQRPVMGYNTWYQYGRVATEAGVLTQAKKMKADGLLAAGYNVLTIDDGWQGTSPAQRAAGAAMTWNPVKFPHGIPWLAAQLKSMGFKPGIYTAIGYRTCWDHGYGGAGSYGHYQQDADTFAAWGVSFIKVDDCGGLPPGTTDAQLVSDYQLFGEDIRADGMAYSQEAPVFVAASDFTAAVAAASAVGGQWRVAADEHTYETATEIVIEHLLIDLPLARYAGPGRWNDLDMLVPGLVGAHRFNFTVADEESQLAVWAMEASPLILSTDVPALTPAELAPLKNPDMIAVDQSGAQASHYGTSGTIRYAYKGADGGMAVLLANAGPGTTSVALPFRQVGVSSGTEKVQNVFGGTVTAGDLRATLAPGQAELFVLRAA
jgi:alpha-galactosidase